MPVTFQNPTGQDIGLQNEYPFGVEVDGYNPYNETQFGIAFGLAIDQRKHIGDIFCSARSQIDGVEYVSASENYYSSYHSNPDEANLSEDIINYPHGGSWPQINHAVTYYKRNWIGGGDFEGHFEEAMLG